MEIILPEGRIAKSEKVLISFFGRSPHALLDPQQSELAMRCETASGRRPHFQA